MVVALTTLIGRERCFIQEKMYCKGWLQPLLQHKNVLHILCNKNRIESIIVQHSFSLKFAFAFEKCLFQRFFLGGEGEEGACNAM